MNSHNQHDVFDEGGEHAEAVGFDYDAVERELGTNLFSTEAKQELEELTPEEAEAVYQMFRRLLLWWWQDGVVRNESGLVVRGILLCWIFVKELRDGHSLTEMAESSGRFKQSLGRWHDRFKRDFPTIRTCHMQFKPKPKPLCDKS
jgi:hypothetical protein